MSLEIDLGEFLSAYLAEAEEHVGSANVKFLAMERAAQEGKTDPRAVRDVYRALHTLKGLSAMVGVDAIVQIAHAMETIVRAAEKGAVALPLETIEFLFEGLRAIEERLAAVARGEKAPAAPPALIAKLDAARVPDAATQAGASTTLELDPVIEAKLAPFERQLLLQAPATGKRALRVDFAPSPKRAAEGLTINSVRERVGAVADVIKVVPMSVPAGDAAPGGLSFALLLVTSADDATVAAAAGSSVSDVISLDARAVVPSPSTDSYLPEAPDDIGGGRTRRGLLRVDVARVDDAMERLSLLLVTRSRLARVVAELTAAGAPTRELAAISQEVTRQLRDLRAAILGLRMVPFADILARLPLLVRGLSRTSGKEIRLVTEANDAELDKAVAERVFPALVHLLRNAIDHGIERSSERLTSGKPPHGTVRVSCTMTSNRQMAIRIADDGAGIDREELARTVGHAIEPSGAAILDVLCRAGVSTRREATSTSGRGMGMDIVRKTVVDQLGGELALETTRGAGTIFTLRIPLTVAVLDAFTVMCGGETFAVPVMSVEEIIEVDDASLVRTPSRGAEEITLTEHRGEAMPVVHLFHALGRAPTAGLGTARHALVVRRAAEPIAFWLDRVVGQQETVVRPLVDPLVQAPGIAGSADLGDGRATLVLDLLALAAKVGARSTRTEAHA
jgi:two-component system, chemotaxis family, sensor kinase CheA